MANPNIDDINQQIADLRQQLDLLPQSPFDPTQLKLANNELRILKESLREMGSDLDYISKSFRDSIAELSKQNSELTKVRSSLRGISDISVKLIEYRKGDLDLSKKELDNLAEKAKLQFQSLDISIKSGRLSAQQSDEAKASLKQQRLFTAELDKIQKFQENIGKNAGVKLFGGVADLAKSIPGLREFSGPLQEAASAAKEDARVKNLTNQTALSTGKGLTKEKIAEMGFSDQLGDLSGIAAAKKATALGLNAPAVGMMGPLMAGFKALGPIIKEVLGPIFWVTMLFEGLKNADKETTELKKSMALNTIESTKFRTNIALAAASTGNINITTSKLLETFSSINKQFGYISNFTADTLVTTTKLTNVVGVAAESSNNLAAASELNGLNFENTYKNAIGTSYEIQRQAGIQVDLRTVLTESGKITGQIRANLGANPVKLAEAITQAHLFGISLEDINSAGKTMLDFESSISNELQAELLLGRDINLEKVRSAALNGDQVGLTKALNEQIGTYSDFAAMNVLQQQSLAAAVGLTVDKLEEALFTQDLQNKSRRELVALGGEDLANRIESQTLAEKFNATIEKLKGIFTDVATALMPILQLLGGILKIIGKIMEFIPPGMLLGAGLGATIGGPWGALVGAAIGGFSDVTTKHFSQAGDIISPASGETQISTKEGGLYNLSRNDDVVAAPGLINKLNSSQSSNVQNIVYDNKEARETNMLLRQMLSKQGTVQIDNTKIGTAFAMNTYEIQ